MHVTLEDGLAAARGAQAQGHISDAQRVWAELRRDFPDAVPPFVEAARSLRAAKLYDEAEALYVAGLERSPDNIELHLERARTSEQAGDPEKTLRLWQIVTERLPNHWLGHVGTSWALRGVGRTDEGDALLLETQARLPHEFMPFHDYAVAAEKAEDWEEAARRWKWAVERGPVNALSHERGIAALRKLDRYDAADTVALGAQETFPNEPKFQIEYCRNAVLLKDWPAALARWEAARSRLPETAQILIGMAETLRALGRAEDADATIMAAADQFASDVHLQISAGFLAEARRDWASADRYWINTAAADPNSYFGHLGIAKTALRRGETEAGLHMLKDIFARFAPRDDRCLAFVAILAIGNIGDPGDPFLAELEAATARRSMPETCLAYAEFAKNRNDYQDYRKRLEEDVRRFPGDLGLSSRLGQAMELAPADSDCVPAAPWRSASAVESGAMLAHFESLGGDGTRLGCDFGMIQRFLNLEPLGLLRWSFISPASLAKLLRARCEHLGDEATITMNGDRPEYDWALLETRYDIRSNHTHLDRAKVSEERARQMVAQRFRFLSRKLLNDMVSGEKIFVYRLCGSTLADGEARDIAQAVAAIGPAPLVLVGEGEHANAPFDVTEISTQCLLFTCAVTGLGDSLDTIRKSWLDICRHALGHFQQLASAR